MSCRSIYTLALVLLKFKLYRVAERLGLVVGTTSFGYKKCWFESLRLPFSFDKLKKTFFWQFLILLSILQLKKRFIVEKHYMYSLEDFSIPCTSVIAGYISCSDINIINKLPKCTLHLHYLLIMLCDVVYFTHMSIVIVAMHVFPLYVFW